MARVGSRPVWHLRRRQKLYSISDQQLLRLAELRLLQAGDLLWRPRLGWKPAESVVSVLAPLPPVTCAKSGNLLSTAWKSVVRWQVKLALIAKQHAQFIKLPLPRYPRWQKFNLGHFLRRPVSLEGLLIVLVFAGSIGVAILASFAIGAQAPADYTPPPKQQYRQIAEIAPDATGPSQTSNLSESQLAIEHSAAQAESAPQPYSVPDPHSVSRSDSAEQANSVSNRLSVSQSSVQANSAPDEPTSVSQSSTQVDLVSDPTSGSQSESAPQLGLVPLPTRKPERPNTTTVKRVAKRHAEGQPKPIRFGGFGYNYRDPAQ
jgi:hypothetical protein